MKSHWPTIAIKDLAEVVTKGTTPTSIGHAFTEDGINFIKVESISADGRLLHHKLAHISTECHEALRRSQIRAGDILFSIAGALGRTAIVTEDLVPANTNQALSIIRLKENAGMHGPFLAHALSSGLLFDQIEAVRGGVAQQNLSLAQVKSFKVPLPPLEEQLRIVAVLEGAFEALASARANAEANLASAHELFEVIKTSAFQEARNDAKSVTLDDVLEISSSLVDPREDAFADMLHLGAGNMISGSDELVDVKTARDEGLISGKYLFDQSCVLYSKIRPYLRKVARPDFAGLCSADVYPLVPKADMIDRDFLFHLLLSDDFTRYAIDGSDRAGMPKVNRNHLFAYSFMLPDLDSQRMAAAKIDEAKRHCDRLVALAEDKLKAIEALRQSLLHRAFSGGLT